MPTLCAEAHLHLYGRHDIPVEWGVSEELTRYVPEGHGLRITQPDGSLIAALAETLAMVAEHDLVLASGHLDKAETKRLAREAKTAGLKRVVLTHPLFQATELEPDELRDLWLETGAYCELCFVNMAMDNLGIEAYADVIRAVGAEGCILSSDVGQIFSPSLTESMQTYFDMLRGQGFPTTISSGCPSSTHESCCSTERHFREHRSVESFRDDRHGSFAVDRIHPG